MSFTRDIPFRDDTCAYCDFDGMVIVFQNEDGEEVPVCSGCLENVLEAFYDKDLELRR